MSRSCWSSHERGPASAVGDAPATAPPLLAPRLDFQLQVRDVFWKQNRIGTHAQDSPERRPTTWTSRWAARGDDAVGMLLIFFRNLRGTFDGRGHGNVEAMQPGGSSSMREREDRHRPTWRRCGCETEWACTSRSSPNGSGDQRAGRLAHPREGGGRLLERRTVSAPSSGWDSLNDTSDGLPGARALAQDEHPRPGRRRRGEPRHQLRGQRRRAGPRRRRPRSRTCGETSLRREPVHVGGPPSNPRRTYSRLAASRLGREVRSTVLAPAARPGRRRRSTRASPTPAPRATSSTTTSSIQARTPVGIRKRARVSEPTMPPWGPAPRTGCWHPSSRWPASSSGWSGRRGRQLGNQADEGIDQVVGDLDDLGNGDSGGRGRRVGHGWRV